MAIQTNMKATEETLGNMASVNRSKYWSEIDVNEKIERLRNLCHSLMETNRNLQQEISVLKSHTHDKDGKAVQIKPLTEIHGYSSGIGSIAQSINKDETYI